VNRFSARFLNALLFSDNGSGERAGSAYLHGRGALETVFGVATYYDYFPIQDRAALRQLRAAIARVLDPAGVEEQARGAVDIELVAQRIHASAK